MSRGSRLWQLAQQWLVRNSKQEVVRTRRRVRPVLEVLEDRLTPSGDVLAITTAPLNIATGQPSQIITVQLQDGSGKAVTATSNVTVNLSSTSSGGQFLNTSGTALPHSSATIQKGSSTVSFEYEDTQTGIWTLDAKAPALNLATSQHEVIGLWLDIMPPSGAITPGQASAPFSVGLYGQNGLYTSSSPLTVQLSSSSSTGQFLDASGKALTKGLLTLPVGATWTNFEYTDSKEGLPAIVAALDGASTVTQADVGISLVFTTPAQTLKDGQPSGTITVQLQDSHGKAFSTPTASNVYVSTNSQTGQVLDSSGNPISSVFSMPAGSNSVSFKYEDSIGGKPSLIAQLSPVGGTNGVNLSATQQETVIAPYKVSVSAPTQMIAQNQASEPFTVQLLDSTGNVATVASAMTVQLSSSSSSGQFLDASGKLLSNGHLVIPAGTGSASFEYKDSKAGFPSLTVTEYNFTSTRQVNVGVSLVFTTAAQSLKAGQASKPITVQLQDSSGKPFITSTNLPVYLASNSSGMFLDTQGHAAYYGEWFIPAGSSSLSFEYEDSVGGKPTLSAYLQAMNGLQIAASQQETVTGPYRVEMDATLLPINLNQPSQPIAVRLVDSTGNVVTTPKAVTVQLSSSSSTGQFLDAFGKVLPTGQLTIPAGSSSVSFEYKDSRAGFPTLTVKENGFTGGVQVNVGISLVFTTPAQTLKAGQKSQLMTVQLQDSNGKAFLAPFPMYVSVDSNSSSGRILDSSGNGYYGGFQIQAGTSSVSFRYEDSIGGKPTLTFNTASDNGIMMSATQQETVVGPYLVGFYLPQPLPALTPNKPSQPITVQLLDSTGNVTKTTSAVTVQLTSTSITGQFLDASGNVLPNGRLTIPAGSGSATFSYKDSKTGFPMLTATENGFSSSIQVNVGVSLVFTTPPRSFKTGQNSGTITVQMRDSNGKPFLATSNVGITVSSSLNTVQFPSPTLPLVPYSTTIPTGSSSASFTISSQWGGTTTLTAMLTSLGAFTEMNPALSATQQETIQGLSSLAFTTSPQTVTAGQKSQRVTLQLEDNNGKAAVAPAGGLILDLSSSLYSPPGSSLLTFFDANGKPLSTSNSSAGPGSATLILPGGSSTVSFEFETTQAGPLPLYINVPNGPFVQQVEMPQAGPPQALVFQTPTQTLPAGVPSGSITVQLQDQYGNPVAAGRGGLTFTLKSSSSSGTFLSANGDPLTTSTITLPQGVSSATFEYKDSKVGTPTLTVSAKGFTATQTESITATSAEIHVTNTKDSGSGSLRSAILTANIHPGSTIVFDAGVRGTIDLLSGLPFLTASTNILGPGAKLLTIERSAAATTDFGIFVVGTNTSVVEPTVVISDLTVANATESGITNQGYLTLRRVVVENNHVTQPTILNVNSLPYGSTGGIENTGNLTVLDSTITDNSSTSTFGAGGITSGHGFVLIINSTISGNSCAKSLGAGGISIFTGTALIENSTISGNTTFQPAGSSSISGGIDSDGQVTLYDTIVAGNTGSSGNPTDVLGAFISLGHNLIGKANSLSSGFLSSDLVGTIAKPIDPKLGALADNGGPTPTLALLAGSPALRAGSSVDAPSTDQRGDARPQGASDIGAFERTTS